MSTQKLISRPRFPGKRTVFCILAIALSGLEACTPIPQRDPAFSPVAPADLRPPVQSSGSIYQAGYDMRLFEDHTAKRVGDILTITLMEATQATKADDLNTKKRDLDVGFGSLYAWYCSIRLYRAES